MTANEIQCPVCGASMSSAFTATLLRKHEVRYFSCVACGLLKTEPPYWLESAYSEAITESDTGLVRRNLEHSTLLEPVLYRLFNDQGPFLDVAGGYGLLARMLRDKGFDCFSTDPYCKNIFASHFEPGPGFNAKALFACEVVEHVEDPRKFIEELFKRYGSDTLVFSTVTFEGRVPGKSWWYYGFDYGQHITFYQVRTLARLAESLGMRYHAISSTLHLFTSRRLGTLDRVLLTGRYARWLYAGYVRWKRRGRSKTMDDHVLVNEKRIGHG